jgi:OFA family oxalate/formate antiporter-like MFS transporter
MTTTINRWAVLVGAVAILLCTGVIYSFSVFVDPFQAAYHWSRPDIMLAFTINGAVAPIPMILGGFIVDRGGARASILLGGLLFTLGFILTGYSTSLGMLYLTYGVIAGLGQGFAYSGCLSNTLKLFPDKRGMAAGLITGGMGAGTVVGAPVAERLIDAYGLRTAFVSMGLVYTVIVILGWSFIKAAPVGYTPPGWVPPAAAGGQVNVPWTAMMRTTTFYFIFVMLFVGAFSGLMIASQASPIGKNMFGLSAATAAGFVSLYSACNAAGRVAWGAVSDRLGYLRAIMMIYGVVALSMLVLVSLDSTVAFAAGIVGLGLCFGGVMGVFPALVMKHFGPRFQGVNYGIMFSAYSLAAYFGPKIAANISVSHGGDYTNAFWMAIILAMAGVLVTLVFARVQDGRGEAPAPV